MTILVEQEVPASDNLCIYHKKCCDGFGSALAVKIWANENNKQFDFLAAQYGEEAPHDVEGKNIIIVDFSYPRDVLLEMHAKAKSVLVIDHHKTAKKNLEGLDFCIFDMSKSGAVLTWQYFFDESREIPSMLLYIQDRDLWRWELSESKAISAGIRSLDFCFDQWMPYMDSKNLPVLLSKGREILKQEQRRIAEITSVKPKIISILGYKVPCLQSDEFISEVCGQIAAGYPFAAVYFETKTHRVYGLRSSPDGKDVSEIAKKFGGGGHKHASGFQVDKDYKGFDL